MTNTNRTPFEIRLELINQARLILSARASKPSEQPSTELVIEEAKKLNNFISRRGDINEY